MRTSENSEHLWSACKRFPEDFQPYGERDREDDKFADCSCGCRFFWPIVGAPGMDWGVCSNPRSHRCGLLTWEHMGCPQFEQEDDAETMRRIGPLPWPAIEPRPASWFRRFVPTVFGRRKR